MDETPLDKTPSPVPTPLQSSVDPHKYSLTVKALIPALVPLIMMLARSVGIEVAETDLVHLIELLAGATAIIMAAIGTSRKMVSKESTSALKVVKDSKDKTKP